jgi:hypothetical protein
MTAMNGDAVEVFLKAGGDEIKARGKTKTRGELNSALASVDQDAIINEEDAEYTTEIWDRKSPINGVGALDVLKRRSDIPATGKVYLVKDSSGRVIYFQPHDPTLEGIVAMTDANVQERADDARQAHANAIASQRIVRAVVDALDPPTP